jgi:hypothetical protein
VPILEPKLSGDCGLQGKSGLLPPQLRRVNSAILGNQVKVPIPAGADLSLSGTAAYF